MFGQTPLKPLFSRLFPSWLDLFAAVSAGILLILAFPSAEIYCLAFVSIAILLLITKRNAQTPRKALILGCVFGFVFFYGSCWWLTYAPIHYASIPAILAYGALVPAALIVGSFAGIFAYLQAKIFRAFGNKALILAPVLWTATELARLHLTGNAWNALGYAFFKDGVRQLAAFGGVFIVSFYVTAAASVIYLMFENLKTFLYRKKLDRKQILNFSALCSAALAMVFAPSFIFRKNAPQISKEIEAEVIAVQPNVPMSGLSYELYNRLRDDHFNLSAAARNEIAPYSAEKARVIIFPESPMNFRYSQDDEFREWLALLASENRASVLFNSSEPAILTQGFYNSAVLVNQKGVKTSQYDKIRLMPFGEYVPLPRPFDTVLSGFVGTFERGEKISLMPFGKARAGVFICFESLFGNFVRQFTADGADVLVEITNDGYLGNTPVLRQHLSNAVFRAVESNRPLLRVTNTGITAYISAEGEIINPTEPYESDFRVWQISKSDGKQTFYVRWGDWFAWFCVLISLIFIAYGWNKKITE